METEEKEQVQQQEQHKLPPANANGINHSKARSCASLTAGAACLHLPAYADAQTIKNEYGVKMSIRANAGIMKDENRSKTGKSGAGLRKNRKQERMRV